MKKAVSLVMSLMMCLSMTSMFSAYVSAAPDGASEDAAIVTEQIDEAGAPCVIDFNDNWKFFLATRTPSVAQGANNAANFRLYGLADAGGVTTADVITPAFNDSAWRTVTVPHDFSIEGEKVSGGTSANHGYIGAGLGWYRKTFVVSESLRSKTITIDFEGVYQNSVVYVNGTLVGNYPNGYTGFSYDITEFLHYGTAAPNVVVVKVQNMSPSGRWYTGTGITRPVSLVVTEQQARYARHGVVITTPTIENDFKTKSPAVRVTAKAYVGAKGSLSIKTNVYDASGALVLSSDSAPVICGAEGTYQLDDNFVLSDVHLWSTDDPYRYTITADLFFDAGGGPVLVDSAAYKYGFRYFQADPEKGFFVNGEHLKLNGVNNHHDVGALGGVESYDALKRELLICKSMGINALRTSHNPPSKACIDLCSELGIVVVEEAFDGWGGTKAAYDFGNFFLVEVPSDWPGAPEAQPAHTMWSDWVIKEMVSRDINEPSVAMWSLGNELNGVGTKPAWYDWHDYLLPGDPVPTSFARGETDTNTATTNINFNYYGETLRLRNDIKSLDLSRYIVHGTDKEKPSAPAPDTVWGYINAVVDGIGTNYNLAATSDLLHAAYPDTFFFCSEAASQTSVRGYYYDPSLPNTMQDMTPGHRGTSSYDNNLSSWTYPHEYGLKRARDREHFIGSFVWSGFDYIGEPTPFGVYPVGVSLFGAVDTAGFPKDAYYAYKSQWSQDPFAHIVPMNWNDWRPGEDVEVWVYTNAVKAELFLNGVSLGERSFALKTTEFGLKYYETHEPTQDSSGGNVLANNQSDINPGGYVSPNGEYGKLHLTWHVPFAPGELKVVATDVDGREVAADVIKTAGQAYTIRMKADKSVIKADGRSLAYIECDVVDENGVTLPSAGQRIKFDVTGGYIVGVDNGQQESAEPYKWEGVEKNTHSERSAFNGRALVVIQSDHDAGDITVTASSEYMAPSTITVRATDDGNGDYTAVCAPEPLGTPVRVSELVLTTAVGRVPAIPTAVNVTYDSGITLVKKAVWDNIKAADFTASKTIEVSGTVPLTENGVDLPARAVITIDGTASADNIALNTAAINTATVSDMGALATASYTSGTNYPNNMLNGNTTSRWTNKYTTSTSNAAGKVVRLVKDARPYEFVEVYWPSPKTFAEIDLYFVIDAASTAGPGSNIPKSLSVQYWDGFAWVDAANQKTQLATETLAASKITFDRVIASRVRVGMENATPYSQETGAMTIAKFEVYDSSEYTVTNATFHNDASSQGADPYVLYDAASGYYYAYSTDGARSGYRFGIYRSADLTTWERLSGAIPTNDPNTWANDWFWAPECYYNPNNGYYYLFYAGRMTRNEDKLTHFGFTSFEEACKTGVAVSKSPEGPFYNIEKAPIDYYPYDPNYHDVNLIMDATQKSPPTTLAEGETAPLGVYLPFIDPNVFFDDNGDIYLYYSRNAYRNWVWDTTLGKYIEESNIYAVKMTTGWWNANEPVMPTVDASYINANKPLNDTSSARKDGFVPVISYRDEPQAWENAHVDDFASTNGANKDRRWAEGSTTMKFTYTLDGEARSQYYMVYSCNNYANIWYGEGYAVADDPLGPWKKYAGNPIVKMTETEGRSVYSTGHGSFVNSPDGTELYHVYHARPTNTGGRYLYTDEVVFDTQNLDGDGHPILRVKQTLGDQPVPSGTAPYRVSVAFSESQSGLALSFAVKNADGGALALSSTANRVAVAVSDPDAAEYVSGGVGGGTLRILSPAEPFTVTFTYQRRKADGTYFDVYNDIGDPSSLARYQLDIAPGLYTDAALKDGAVSVSVINNTEEVQSVRLIAAAYDAASGRLLQTAGAESLVSAGGLAVRTLAFDTSKLTEAYTVKVFTWDSGTLVPLGEPVIAQPA
jgi:beta-galactosidase